MPNHSRSIAVRRFQCRHIFTDGHRCGSPCLRTQDFCYYHHTTRRPKPAAFHDPFLHPPNETSFTLPTPEDPSAIQHAIGEIMNALARNALDPRRAGLLLYALQIASLNLQSAGRRNGPGHPNQAQPDNAAETVEDFTLDPELGPLAPPAEVGDNQPKGSALRLLEELDTRLNEREPGNLPTLQAVANCRPSEVHRLRNGSSIPKGGLHAAAGLPGPLALSCHSVLASSAPRLTPAFKTAF